MSTSMTGLTRGPAGGEGKLHQEGRSPVSGGFVTGLIHRSKFYAVLVCMLAPAVLGMLLFTYYPQWDAIRFSMYEWNGTDDVRDYIGLDNFRRALGDPIFWSSFQLVLILLAANIVKMWPSICAAIVLHRLRNERWQYLYRVLFVVPMIIPGIVSLLVWKSFFDAGTGALNAFLNATGLMHALHLLDHGMARVTSTAVATHVREQFVIGGVHGLWWVTLLAVLLIAGQALRRLFTPRGLPMRTAWLNYTAAAMLVAAVLVALVFCVWPTKPMDVFKFGTPPWLGNQNLIIPSVIFWGFPWVGTVGVLIYLAGLANISTDVYEAAELDGVGSVGKLFSIELPLIMTQVRINLIFLTIGTITDYGFFFLLLGLDGGPGAKGMVPGLYMLRSAFIDQKYGYACALGMILFVILLAITVLYQRFVKVDK